jgi:hypothetical protein
VPEAARIAIDPGAEHGCPVHEHAPFCFGPAAVEEAFDSFSAEFEELCLLDALRDAQQN